MQHIIQEMNNWATNTIAELEVKLDGIRDKEIRFYRIEELKRNIKRIDEFSKSCQHCKEEKIHIDEILKNIDTAIKVPGKTRREYDRLISRISSHMHKQHGFITPYYYSYLYSFFGIVAGLAIGYILQKVSSTKNWELMLIGFILGLLPGYFIGHYKDKKIRADKKLM